MGWFTPKSPEIIQPSRRSFLRGAGASLVAAPFVVKAASLMPVRGFLSEIPPMKPVMLDPLGVEIARITRQRFIPSLYLQIYQSNPLAQLLTQRAA